MDDASSFSIDFNDRFGFLRSEESLIDPPVIRVYLAGPLTNNDSDLSRECHQIRAAIKLALADYEYLGVRFTVYDPAEVTSPESDHTAEEVYATDHLCTICADVVVFVVNTPSLGVGIEAQLSASATTPRIVISKQSVPTSRMFRGMFSSTIIEVSYQSVGDVYGQLSAQLIDICPKVIESIERRRLHIDAIVGQNLGRRFLHRRIRHGVTLDHLSKCTDIQRWWLDKLERCPEFATTLSLAQLYRICDVLFCRANLKNGMFDIVDQNSELQTHERDSLENLIDFVMSRPKANEDRIFRIWDEYLEIENRQSAEGAAARGLQFGSATVSAEDWRRRYDESQLF